MNKKYSENLEEIDSLAELLGLLIVVLIIIGIIFGILGLVCWGVVNGVLFLFGMPTTFTYTQGLILAFVIRGIRIIIGQIVKIGNKE